MSTELHNFAKPFSAFDNEPLLKSVHEDVTYEGALVAKHTNLLALMLEWLQSEARSLFLGVSVAEEGGAPIGVSVVLEDASGERHGIYFTYEELQEVYPSVAPLNQFTHLSMHNDFGRPKIEVDDKRLSAALGFCTKELFHYEIHAPLLNSTQAIAYALSFASSGSGDATICKVSQSRFDEFDISTIVQNGQSLYWMTLHYKMEEPETNNGFILGEYAYFIANDADVTKNF